MFSLKHLPSQNNGEKIIKVMRRDLVILLKKVLFNAVLALAPAIILTIVGLNNAGILAESPYFPPIVLAISAYYLFIWLFFFFSFIDYYLDVWIVTTHRIINIEQKGFFSRIVSEQTLDRVQDVTSETEGILATFFNYGNLHIQTAGTKGRFVFEEIPNPNEVRNLITKLTEKFKSEMPPKQ